MTALACLVCGLRLNRHACVTAPGARPEDGDLSVCWRCTAPAIYTLSPLGVLGLRALTAAEEREAMAGHTVAAILAERRRGRDPVAVAAAAHRRIGAAPVGGGS